MLEELCQSCQCSGSLLPCQFCPSARQKRAQSSPVRRCSAVHARKSCLTAALRACLRPEPTGMAVWGELAAVDQVDDKFAFAQARDALDEVAHVPVVNDCGERSVGLTELVRLHCLTLVGSSAIAY